MVERFGARAGHAVEGLTPGYFALVMATGILSVGMHLEGFDGLSTALLAVCCTAFVVLLALTGWRLVSYRSAVVDDFTDPRRGFGFFTFVAGTNVLGVRLGLAGFHEATAVLLAIAGVAWLALGYVVPWTAVLGRQERPVLATANGTWFIWVVASQSVAVAAATIEPVFDSVRRELAVLAIMSWSVGVFLYAAAGLLVALRLMLYEFGPEELDPSVLGLDGGPGHHRAGRRPDRGDGRCADGHRDPGPDCRTGGGVLGVRDLADPGAGGRGLVASRPPAGAAAV